MFVASLTVLVPLQFQAPLPQNAPASRWASRLKDGKGSPPADFSRRPMKPRLSPQAAAQEKLAKAGSLPWNLPAAKEQGDSNMRGHREALDKMLDGSR